MRDKPSRQDMREQQIALTPSKQIIVAKEKYRYEEGRCLTTYVERKKTEKIEVDNIQQGLEIRILEPSSSILIEYFQSVSYALKFNSGSIVDSSISLV
jgi:hypothetical protein